MVYVYRRSASTGARELAEALSGRRYRANQRPINHVVQRGDVIVCWGESLPAIPGVLILNGGVIRNKLTDALTLKAAGVPTIEATNVRPIAVDPAQPIFDEAKAAAEEFSNLSFARSQPLRDGTVSLYNTIQRLVNAFNVAAPIILSGEWLPRLFNHTGGEDLLDPPDEPEYFVKKDTFTKEYRIHSFNGKSIRAGIKAPRDGFATPHTWIRSWDSGWRIKYDGVSSKQRHRDLAHQAVAALGLTFGAVDIGEKADRSLVVLEVNRAPGVEGGSVQVYASAIQAWIAEQSGTARRAA
jgi:hypothetical protein